MRHPLVTDMGYPLWMIYRLNFFVTVWLIVRKKYLAKYSIPFKTQLSEKYLNKVGLKSVIEFLGEVYYQRQFRCTQE